jgi:hypothetical protein
MKIPFANCSFFIADNKQVPAKSYLLQVENARIVLVLVCFVWMCWLGVLSGQE